MPDSGEAEEGLRATMFTGDGVAGSSQQRQGGAPAGH
jgi:hypothetical protein